MALFSKKKPPVIKEGTNIRDAVDLVDIPPKGKRGHRKRIKHERKKLRRELKRNGIKKRVDFERMASELGLVLDNGRAFAFWMRWELLKGFLTSGWGMLATVLGAFALLGGVFLYSTITEQAGTFTINLTADMVDHGFLLSETDSFEETTSRLFTTEVEQVTNITLDDISSNVDEIDGSHNGADYVAYSFYVLNDGDTVGSYEYIINMDEDILDVGDALWVMVYEEGKQVIYAKASADGDPEELYGYTRAPFIDDTYYSDQYYEEDGKYGVITTSFISDEIVMQGIVTDIQPGDYRRYTIVIWVEGYDPECTNDIFGGYAKLSMYFEPIELTTDKNIFDGVFRTEYDDYITYYNIEE